MYNNGIGEQVAPVQWFRRSTDGGKTWTQPIRPFPTHVGRNGEIAFVVDSNDILHVFFGQRIPSGGIDATHGMWHSMWQGGGWSPPGAVVTGTGRPDFDPYDARAVVSQGNTILVTWRTDPGVGEKSTWFSYLKLDAPGLPIVALPAVLPTSVPTPTATVQMGSEPTSIQATATPSTDTGDSDSLPLSVEPATPPSNPGMPLVVGVVPALLFIAATYVMKRLN